MSKTYTEQAIAKIERQVEVATKDGGIASTRDIRITVDKNGRGRYMCGGQRVSYEQAIQHLAAQLEREDQAPDSPKGVQRTNFAWDRLNGNTQDFFAKLCEDMLTVTKDASLSVPVRLGYDIPKIGPQNQPRLTNLKKANLLESYNGEKKSHKMLG